MSTKVEKCALNCDYYADNAARFLDDDALEEMGSLDPMDYAVYFILHIRREANGTTLQAKPHAPIIVNVRSRQARQVVVPATTSTEKAEALCLQL